MNDREIDHHIDGIRSVDLTRLGLDLHRACGTTRRNPSYPDGYPTTASGSDTGGSGNAELTSVERAAHQTLGDNIRHPARRKPDAYDRIVYKAADYLRDADHALRAARNQLDQLTKLQDATDLPEPDTACWALARIGSWEPATYSVVVDGEPRKLGSWAYKFHRSNRRLPTLDECKRHARGEKIYVKAG